MALRSAIFSTGLSCVARRVAQATPAIPATRAFLQPATLGARRLFATDRGLVEHDGRSSGLGEHRPENLSTGQKVARATKDTSYFLVIVAGLGLTGIFLYSVFSELFSGTSINTLYGKALDEVCEDQRIKDLVGEPIKGFGETTRRGRRRHISSQEYVVDNVNYIRAKFYISGSKSRGTVFMELKEETPGEYVYRYLFVESPGDGLPSKRVILQDNR